jgi:hypothetical protein
VIARRQSYLSAEDESSMLTMTARVAALIHGLMRSLRQA